MISLAPYKGKIVGVFGLGKAGAATVTALQAGGAKVIAWDDNEASRHIITSGELLPLNQWPWKELAALVLSPGVPLTHPKPHASVEMAKQHNVPVVGDIELLYQAQPNARYIAITGTNGKSTTTSLIGHILKHAGRKVEVGGNLGTPALSLAPLEADAAYVLELSSYQLDLLHTARFNIAVLMNITPDHLDRHGNMEGYVKAKMHIFDRQQKGDVAIIAVDDEYTKQMHKTLLARKDISVVPVSVTQELTHGIFAESGKLYDRHDKEAGEPVDISVVTSLMGRHNWQNAAAAYAACRTYGLSREEIEAGLRTFPGLAHRMQLVNTVRGVRFINDSKATNADATSNALAPFDNIYWIIGGKPKAGGILPLIKFFPKIAHAFLIGEAEEEFAQTLEGRVPYTRCGTLAVATKAAAEKAWAEKKKDAVVLLSPACASFDQWKNFEERGEAFCRMVKEFA